LRLALIAVVIAAVTTVAFLFRRLGLWAILRYLEGRSMRAWRALVAEYLAGRLSLDAAAAQFNQIQARFIGYAARAERLRPGGQSHLKSLSLAPPGYRDDDPRLHALTEHASLLHFGPERYAEMRASWRKHAQPSVSAHPEETP